MKQARILIGRDWQEGEDVVEVRDPFGGEAVGTVFLAGKKQVEEAMQVAGLAFAETRVQKPSERAQVLSKTSELIGKRANDFVDLLIREAGKPRKFAEQEVLRAQQTFAVAAKETLISFEETVAMDMTPAGEKHTCLTNRFPIGMILGITPFNFPLNLVAHKVAPCIAAGNVMLLKPALKTPFCAALLGEVLLEAGMIPGQINVVPFDHHWIPGMLEDARIRMVSFTGSAEVGWKLKAQAVKQRVTLELGGNAALVIHEDARWKERLDRVTAACFGYAGQSCISVQRLFVHESIYAEFREAFLERVAAVKCGDPGESDVMVGPMIDAAACDRVVEWVEEARRVGATLATGLRREENILFPIVLENVPSGTKVSCEEVFGPVVVLTKYNDFEKVLGEVNASRYGLQTGIFTQDKSLAQRAYEVLEAGGVLINEVPTYRVENMPYGGIKDSGFGREGIRYAMEEMTELKSLIYDHS